MDPAVRTLAIGALALMTLAASVLVTRSVGPTRRVSPTGREYPYLLAAGVILAVGCGCACAVVAASRSQREERLRYTAVGVLCLLWAGGSGPVDSSPVTTLLLTAILLASVAWGNRSVIGRRLQPWLVVALFVPAAGTALLIDGVGAAIAVLRLDRMAIMAAWYTTALAGVAVLNTLRAVSRRPSTLLRRNIGRRVALAAVIGKALAVVAVYVVVARFGAGDDGIARLWRARLDAPWTWVHATVIAFAIMVVVIRTWRTPIPQGETVRLLVMFGLLAVLPALIGLVISVIGIVAAAFLGASAWSSVIGAGGVIIERSVVLQLIVVAGASVIALVSGFRRGWTLPRAVAVIAALWWSPLLIMMAAGNGSSDRASAAVPAQVDAVLAFLVPSYLICRRWLASRLPAAEPSNLLRLLIVPSLVLQVGHLIVSSDWTVDVLLPAVVVSVLLVLLWSGPKVSADRRRNEKTVSLLLGGQLMALALAVTALRGAGLPAAEGTAALLAWLVLCVPLAASLSVATCPERESDARSVGLFRRRMRVRLDRLARSAGLSSRAIP
jgi:hypothetical protein